MSKYILASLLILGSGYIWAQDILVEGRVIDKITLEPLVGATVSDNVHSVGTFSGENGIFSLTAQKGSTLIVSYIGYEQMSIPVNQKNLTISLIPVASTIDEVVVTALNLERESKALGYVVQSLDAKDLNTVKHPNFVDNLAGKVSGVQITQGATGIGSSSKVTIRGESSFTNNSPLMVVDGIMINSTTAFNFSNAAASGFQEVDFGNGGMDINPDDVRSVSVLKGPAAAALYGSRAANGAIIITTKDGSESPKLRVNFNSSTFIDRPFRLPQFQNSYGQGNSGQFQFVDGLGGGINDNITYSWGPRLDDGLNISQFDSPVTLPDGTAVRGGDVAVHGGQNISPTPFVSHPDNLKDFYQTGWTTINNLSLGSSFERGNYRLSLTDFRNESYIPGVNFNRQTINTTLTFKPTKRWSITSRINYIKSESDNRPSNGYGSENINYSLVAWGPRSMDIGSLRSYWQPGLEGIQQFSHNYTFFDNPYFILNENRNAFERDRVLGGIHTNYQLSPAISLIFSTGLDDMSEDRFYRRAFSTNRFKTGAYAVQDVGFREVNTQFLINYSEKWQNLSMDLSLGANRMDRETANRQVEALGLAQAGVYNFSNASVPITSFQQNVNKRINSAFGFAKFGFRDFLFLDLTARNDWSSALATPVSVDRSSFFYPSTSVSYVVSNNLNLPKIISFAQLRASWAQVGNDAEPYQTSGSFLAGVPFMSEPSFTASDVLPNPLLVPELTTALEFGFDVRFFDDRLRLDATYYDALTENQITSFPVPISSGYTQQVVNGGSVRAQGVELMLGVDGIRGSNFRWSTFANFSRNVSTVESLPEGADRVTLAFSRVYDNTNQTVWYQAEVGGQIGDMYGTGYLKNENGEFVIDDNGRFIADNDLKKLGNYNPDFTLGLSNEFSYKNWNASFLVDWRQGGILVSRTLALAGVGGQLEETEYRPEEGIVAKGQVNTGTVDAPIWEANTIPISPEAYYRQFYDRNHEENNVYDASFVKLRQFGLGYTFKSNRCKWLTDDQYLNISLIGRNIWAWSEIPHFDPEQIAVQGNQFVSGVEDMSYPTSRSIGFKIGLQF